MPQGMRRWGIGWVAIFSRTSFTAADIFRETAGLMRRNPALCGIGVLALFAIKAGSDLGIQHWSEPGSRSTVFVGLIYIPFAGIVHYLLITRLMQAENLAARGWSPAGLLGYAAAYVLVTIGIICGMVLLIVPGIIFAIRWCIYANFIIGRNLGPIPAIKASWAATSGHGGTIFGALVVIGLATLPGIFLARGGFGVHPDISTATVIIGNIYTAVLGLIGLCITLSIYAMLAGPDYSHYQEVFS